MKVNLLDDALVVVDVQPTFMPGGGLPVPDGDKVVSVINGIAPFFQKKVATRDLHPRYPKGHVSLASSFVGLDSITLLKFEDVESWTDKDHKIASHAGFTLAELKDYLKRVNSQMLWPDHAIVGTRESELHPDLVIMPFVQEKGLDPACDSYSGFRDNLRRSTGLGEILQKVGVTRAFYCGLAFDYCVGFTALDGLEYGIQPVIVMDATRSVADVSNDIMMKKLIDAGAKFVNSNQLVTA